jgi:hypothetical protein
MSQIALCIPHAPHMPGRIESMARLKATIDNSDGPGNDLVRIFADREPHWRWSRKMWRWGLDTGMLHLVQLQDDALVPPNVLAVLHALHAGAPAKADVVALFGVHPIGRELARTGMRWHRSRAWVLGIGYSLSRRFLEGFVPWVEANDARARVTCEDALINAYCVENGIDVYHPLPSVVEHDIGVPSTWGAQSADMGLDKPENHGHRKAVVSWRDYGLAEMARPDFWEQQQDVRLLPESLSPTCWFCLGEPAFISSQETGVQVGPGCFAKMAAEAARRMVNR